MTPQTAHPKAAAPPGVLCVSRDPATRALLGRHAAGGRMYLSAADALLAAARERPSAVVLAIEGTEAAGRQVVAAFRRTRPDVPVYGVVEAAEEPLARSLLGAGLTDYVVLPRDARRLPAVLAGEPETPEPPAPPEPAPSAAMPRRLFDASCRMASLAMAESKSLFREGCRILLDLLGAERGCAFLWSEADERLVLALTLGGDDTLGAVDPDPVHAAADRCLRTAEPLRLPPGSGEAPPDGLVCLPVRDEEAAVGVLCLSPTVEGASPPEEDALLPLAHSLARLYRAAARREEFARLAHRDVETGLLKADPFLTYVDSRIAEARDRETELALILLEPEASVAARTADSPARLGLAVRGALARGWEGGRLETARYAVALPTAGKAKAQGTEDAGESAARRLAGAAPRAHPDLSLRTAIARFPHDGTNAKALVSAAEDQLRSAGRHGP
ncbi:MAG: GAF domain-containing protein [Phycisphaerae bacterium]